MTFHVDGATADSTRVRRGADVLNGDVHPPDESDHPKVRRLPATLDSPSLRLSPGAIQRVPVPDKANDPINYQRYRTLKKNFKLLPDNLDEVFAEAATVGEAFDKADRILASANEHAERTTKKRPLAQGGTRSRPKLGESVAVDRPKPPGGFFLAWGGRDEVGWKSTPGGRVDEVFLAQRGDPQPANSGVQLGAAVQTALPTTTVYKCVRTQTYYPRKGDRVGETPYITADHTPPFSLRLDNGECSLQVCDGTHVWEGVGKQLASESYNDMDRLQAMSVSENSSKGGKKGYDQVVPSVVEDCPHSEAHDHPIANLTEEWNDHL